MQYPVEVPGVSVANFLRTAKTAIDGEAPKLRTWVKDVNATLEAAGLDPTFSQRNVNEGFSGGEKKRHEIAQMQLLDPKIAVLDETDSGLDIDALKVVSEGVNRFAEAGDKGVLLITHYTRILRYIKPDFVHVFVDGRIAEEGGPELADQLEAEGYDKYVEGRGGLTCLPSWATACFRTWRSSARTSRSCRARSAERAAPLVYLDSANTSQKPQVVIDTMVDHLERHNANIARAMHQLGAESTEAFEAARDKVAAFIGAPSRDEVIFTKNTSEALNLVANTLAWAEGDARRSAPGDEVRHHRDGAPLQHRAVAAAHRAHRRDAALVRADRRRPARPVEHRRADHRAHQGGLADLGLQHARHHQPGPPRSPTGPTRSARWSSSTPRRPCRSCPSTWSRRGADLLAFTGHKVGRPDRHRRAVGPLARSSTRCRRSSAAAR